MKTFKTLKTMNIIAESSDAECKGYRLDPRSIVECRSVVLDRSTPLDPRVKNWSYMRVPARGGAVAGGAG